MAKPLQPLTAIAQTFKSLESILPWTAREHEMQQLAQKAEAMSRRLNGLPTSEKAPDDTVAMLQSACVLLERLEGNPVLLQTKVQDVPNKKLGGEVEETNAILFEDLPEADDSQEEEMEVRQLEPELSATAKKLIEVRDWILLAQSDGSAPSTHLLDALSKQLEQVLAQEGVTPLEETGAFDYEKHQVVSTQATDNPELKEQICQTVRPGYWFNGSLVRPQEVVIYTCETPTTHPEEDV